MNEAYTNHAPFWGSVAVVARFSGVSERRNGLYIVGLARRNQKCRMDNLKHTNRDMHIKHLLADVHMELRDRVYHLFVAPPNAR